VYNILGGAKMAEDEQKDKYASQKKYHEKHYKRYGVVMKIPLYEQFSEKAKSKGLSKNGVLVSLIEQFVNDNK
jgi:hypothetical protein